MSEDVKIKAQVTNRESFTVTCRDPDSRVKQFNAEETEVRLFSSKHSGMTAQFDGWSYPVVFKQNEIVFDNYNGKWGDMLHLNRLLRNYAVEESRRLALADGLVPVLDTIEGDNRIIHLRHPSGALAVGTAALGGSIHFEMKEVAGPSCTVMLSGIKAGLGQVLESQLTHDYYLTEIETLTEEESQ